MWGCFRYQRRRNHAFAADQAGDVLETIIIDDLASQEDADAGSEFEEDFAEDAEEEFAEDDESESGFDSDFGLKMTGRRPLMPARRMSPRRLPLPGGLKRPLKISFRQNANFILKMPAKKMKLAHFLSSNTAAQTIICFPRPGSIFSPPLSVTPSARNTFIPTRALRSGIFESPAIPAK
ncbi:MAG: hypothetical protein R2875_13595 [Desulfobacterales bacterium]